ncbi:hypothetical protein D3C75_743090 [compost metagenome]
MFQDFRKLSTLNRAHAAAFSRWIAGFVDEPVHPCSCGFFIFAVNADPQVVVIGQRNQDFVGIGRERHEAYIVRVSGKTLDLTNSPRAKHHRADFAVGQVCLGRFPVRSRRVFFNQSVLGGIVHYFVQIIMRLAWHEVIVGSDLADIDIFTVSGNGSQIRFPLRQCPAGSIVRIERNCVRFFLDALQSGRELVKGSWNLRNPGILEDLLVVDDTGKVNCNWNAVRNTVYTAFFQAGILLLQIGHFTQRFKKVRQVFNGYARRQQQDITVITRAHADFNLILVAGQRFEVNFHIGIFLIELGGVIFEYGINNIRSLRNDRDIALDILGCAAFRSGCRLGVSSCIACIGCCSVVCVIVVR